MVRVRAHHRISPVGHVRQSHLPWSGGPVGANNSTTGNPRCRDRFGERRETCGAGVVSPGALTAAPTIFRQFQHETSWPRVEDPMGYTWYG